MTLDSESCSDSDSSDEDLDVLFLEAAFAEPRSLGTCLNMEDVCEVDV